MKTCERKTQSGRKSRELDRSKVRMEVMKTKKFDVSLTSWNRFQFTWSKVTGDNFDLKLRYQLSW